jgi:hypothetical protein
MMRFPGSRGERRPSAIPALSQRESRHGLLALIVALAVLAPLPAWAQSPFGVGRVSPPPAAQKPATSPNGAPNGARSSESLSLYVHHLEHQKALEAVQLVQPLLSPRGSVELRSAENTITVRDSLSSLTRIIPTLYRFDRPPRQLGIEVLVVQANRVAFSPAIQAPDVPATLLRYFRKLLPYSTYQVLARTEITPDEGQEVMYEVGAGFGVSFRLGTMVNDHNIKLHDFRIARRKEGERQQLLHTTLSLRLDQPLALALAKEESSDRALLVVLTPKPGSLKPATSASDPQQASPQRQR